MSQPQDADRLRQQADAERIQADHERVEADTSRTEVDTDRRDVADASRINADHSRTDADKKREASDAKREDHDSRWIENQALTPPPREEPRIDKHFASYVERGVLVGVALFLLGGILGLIGGWQLYQAVLTNKETSFEGRAVDCRILVAHGQSVNSYQPCVKPEVRKYFNPSEKPAQATSGDAKKNREIYCAGERDRNPHVIAALEAQWGQRCEDPPKPVSP